LRLGTRGSALALTQTSSVKRALEEEGVEVEVVEIETLGDRRDEWKSLQELEGDGVFTRELDAALLEGEVDIAVHSMKDVPTDLPDGVVTAAVPPRESVRDALCGSTLEDLPEGGKVGTGSPRRQAQVKQVRPDVEMANVRGNVETRLGKVGDEVDAVMLAVAGLERLGLGDEITEKLPLEDFLPAPGQGALAVSARKNSTEARRVKEILEDEETRRGTEAERALLNELGTGCVEPIGAHGIIEEGNLVMRAADYEKGTEVEMTGDPEDADSIGREAAKELV